MKNLEVVARGRAYPVEVYLYIPGFRTQVRALVAQRELVASARREFTAPITCHGDLYQIAAPAIWQSR